MKFKVSRKNSIIFIIVFILISSFIAIISKQGTVRNIEEERLRSEIELKIKEEKLKEEAEASFKAEEETRNKADEEAKTKIIEDAKLKAEQEAKVIEEGKNKVDQAASKQSSNESNDKKTNVNTAQDSATIADNLKSVSSNNQLIIVTTKEYGTSNATIRTFERNSNGKWKALLTINGFIGRDGFAKQMSERDVKSPRGKFSIGTAFGRYDNPGTGIDYKKIGSDDYWVDDSNSSLYNTWQTGTSNGRWDSAEKMDIPAYNYGFVIEYNTDRIPGAGSAIFFHISNSYTMGCTGVSQSNMVNILKWLDAGKNPTIIQCPESELSNY